jgi:negative regulator of flagellin synthesis FlgM
MDISKNIPPVVPKAAVQTVKPVNKTTAPVEVQAPVGGQGDRVELSEQAKTIQAAHRLIQQIPEVDEEKVARIKEQIASGTYRVDSQKTAEKILADALIEGTK